jgi:hypothetical protein
MKEIEKECGPTDEKCKIIRIYSLIGMLSDEIALNLKFAKENNDRLNGMYRSIERAARSNLNDKSTSHVLEKLHKSQDALNKIGFLPKYLGIIVKDGTELYNPFGILLAQCLSHIQRYLVDFYTKIKHNAPKKMTEFLSNCNLIRNKKIDDGIDRFTNEEYNALIEEYDNIINEWEQEIKNDSSNYLIDDEIKLFTRMKYDSKKMNKNIRGDKEEILYFLKDFNVPATNNQAEVDQRNAKIKQKIGKWRCEDGASNYAIIRSCINTYKKNDVNVFKALVASFNKQPIIV